MYKADIADINDEIDLEEMDQFLESWENANANIYKSQEKTNLKHLSDELDHQIEDEHDESIEELNPEMGESVEEMRKTSKQHYQD